MMTANSKRRQFHSDRALLVGAGSPASATSDDDVQRIFCDWAAKNLLDKTVRDAIASCPLSNIYILERNKYGRSFELSASVSFVQQTLRALDAGELVPTLIEKPKMETEVALMSDEALIELAGELLTLDKPQWLLRLSQLDLLTRIRVRRPLIQMGNESDIPEIKNKVANIVLDIKYINNPGEYGAFKCRPLSPPSKL